MANTRGPLNSGVPTTSVLVGGVYNESSPAPADEQVCALQVDNEGNLLVNVAVGGGGGSSTVKIEDTSGNALNSNGSGALQVAVVSGGGSNASVGTTGAAAPGSATQVGFLQGGNLVVPSLANPLPVAQGTAAASTAGWPTTQGNIAEVTASWTSSTTANTTLVLQPITGYGTVVVTVNQGSTITGGVLTFEVSDTTAFTNAYSVAGQDISNVAAVGAQPTYTLAASTNAAWAFNVAGWAAFRVRLSTAISGTATVVVGIAASAAGTSPVTQIGWVQNVATLTTAGVRSTLAHVSNIGNNNLFANVFGDNGNNVSPLFIAPSAWGGAFSGTANGALQGWSKASQPTIFKTVQATASGNTAVWTPGTGNKFRLLKFQVIVTDASYLASAGTLTVSFQDSTTAIGPAYDITMLGAALTNPDGVLYDSGWVDLGSIGILSAAANNVLNVNLSAALSGGNVRVNVAGIEE